MATDAEFKKACEFAVEQMRSLAPYDTGNLALNAVQIEFVNARECHIYVDEAIAPYMPFTNEPWVSPKWDGKKNPNEGWWQNACEYLVGVIQGQLGGELKGK